MNIRPSFQGYLNVCTSYPDNGQCRNRGVQTSKATDDEFIALLPKLEREEKTNKLTDSAKQMLIDFFKKHIPEDKIKNADEYFNGIDMTSCYCEDAKWFDATFYKQPEGHDNSMLFQYRYETKPQDLDIQA